MASLPEYIASHQPSDIWDEKHTVHSWYHGQEGKSLYEIVKQDPERQATFNAAMKASEGGQAPTLGMFPYESLLDSANGEDRKRTLLVDIGGNTGHTLQIIVDAHSEFANRVILQDLPQVLDRVPKLQGIEKMSYDFNTPQPMQGAKAYLIRRCLHNYSDEKCKAILCNTVSAMSADSRLLIADMLMPDAPSAVDLDGIVVMVRYLLPMQEISEY